MKFKKHFNVSPYLIRQLLATLASCLLTLCSGTTYGITAGMLPRLHDDKEFNYDKSYDSWIASMSVLSMVLGSASSGTIIDIFGRKMGHIILSVPYLLGWLLIGFATSTTYILIGRFITGLSAGATRPLSLVYIGEITDPKYRSATLVQPALFFIAGILLSHLIGVFLFWKTACLVMVVPVLFGLVSCIFIKESPLWLFSKGRTDEAVKTYKWFRGSDESSAKELAIVLERQADKVKSSYKNMFDIFFQKSFVKPFLVLILLMINLQYTGVNIIHFYTKVLFDKTFNGAIDSFTMMIISDCLRAVASVGVCIISNRIPRKKSYISFNILIILSLTVMVVYTALDLSSYTWICLIATILYILFSGAMVTLGWTFLPELLPNKARGIGSGLTSAISFLLLFIGVKLTPDIMKYFGVSVFYGMCTLSTVITVTILFFCLPETHGKTLQSIEDSYKDKSKPKNVDV